MLVLAGAVALAGGGCESSQTKSARLERLGAKAAKTSRVSAGAANPDVKVTGTQVLHSAGATAAVVGLRNTGPAAQAAVPVQIQVKDAHGKALYKNDLEGLQVALQHMAYLGKGEKAFWVHDQVVGADRGRSVTVAVGKPSARAPATRAPRIKLVGAHLTRDSTGRFLTGRVRNASKVTQRNMPIYAVAKRGRRIVAAGRAIIEKLDPDPQPKPTVFRIFFVGNLTGARIEAHAYPTVLEGP